MKVKCGDHTTGFRRLERAITFKLSRFPQVVCESCEPKERCPGGPNGGWKHPVGQPPADI
jgi:hypothetical protein